MDGVSSVDEDDENEDGASRLSDLPEVTARQKTSLLVSKKFHC